MIPFENYSLEQAKYFDFGDQRLNTRSYNCISKMLDSHIHEGFPSIFNDQYELKAFYRLMNNEKVTPWGIAQGYSQGVKSILFDLKKEHKQALTFYQFQDTTYGSYLKRKNLDLGYIENKDDNGLVLHTSLLTDKDFTPIGIADQQVILRDRSDYQKGHDRKKRPFEEKESSKWVKAMEWSTKMKATHQINIIHVADREGDMKEFFNYASDHQLDVIVRVRHDRKMMQEDKKLWQHISNLAPQVIINRQLLRENGTSYIAECQLSWTKVTLKGVNEPLYVVYLKQLDASEEQTATQWAVFSSTPVVKEQEAIQILDIYTHRWRTCEDFHKCLKSGCSMEQRQFESAHAMTNCVAILSITALHLLRLRHLATLDNKPIEALLSPVACQLANHLATKYLKPVDLDECQPQSAKWLALLIARMGGHQGVRQKGLPGWKTLWRGWYDFQKLLDGIILSKNIFEA